jgi:hypothetical protein
MNRSRVSIQRTGEATGKIAARLAELRRASAIAQGHPSVLHPTCEELSRAVEMMYGL